MAQSYFNRVTSLSALIGIIRQENAKDFASLHPVGDKLPSASRWDRSDLLACRVIVKNSRSPPDILPFLESFTHPRDQDWPPFIKNFLDGPPPEAGTLSSTPEHRFVRWCEPASLGSIWAALGEFIRAELEPEKDGSSDISMPNRSRSSSGLSLDLPSAQRSRTQVQHPPGFVDSSTLQAESSSPIDPDREDQSASSKPGSVFVDDGAHGANSPSEEATLHLVRLVLSHVLNYGPPQHRPVPGSHSEDPRPDHLVAMSNTRRSYIGKTLQGRTWVAVDDGGLDVLGWYHPQESRASLGRENRRICHVEAKNKFAIILDGKPSPSDSALAQMTGQALAIGSSSSLRNEKYLCHITTPPL